MATQFIRWGHISNLDEVSYLILFWIRLSFLQLLRFLKRIHLPLVHSGDQASNVLSFLYGF